MKRRLKFSDYYHNIIIEEIAEIYNVEKERIFLGSRKRNIIFAKRLYINVLREVFEFFYNNYIQDTKNFERVENRIIEVEIDEEILGLENKLSTINESLIKLYKINKLKNERQERESLLTK